MVVSLSHLPQFEALVLPTEMILLPLEKIDYLQDLDSTLPEFKETAREARRWIVKMIHEA